MVFCGFESVKVVFLFFIGRPIKSKTQLGWKPQYDLAGLVKEMVASDLEISKRGLEKG